MQDNRSSYGAEFVVSPRNKSIPAVIAALENGGPMTMREIAEETGLGESTVGRALRALRTARKAYVHSYYPTVSQYTPVFALGSERDVERPTGQPHDRPKRKKRRENPEKAAVIYQQRMQQIKRNIRAELRRNPDNRFACLLGQMGAL